MNWVNKINKQRKKFTKGGGGKIIHIFKSHIFLWACTWKIISCGIYSTSRKSHEHNISSLFVIVKIASFINIHFWKNSGQYFWNKLISLNYILFQFESTVYLPGLFDYFQHGKVFLLARDGVQYPIIFAIHSRINPFDSRSFTYITQEITNTLLKKFEGPYSLQR